MGRLHRSERAYVALNRVAVLNLLAGLPERLQAMNLLPSPNVPRRPFLYVAYSPDISFLTKILQRARALRATIESDDTDSGGERTMELGTPLQENMSFMSSYYEEGRPSSPFSPSSAVTSPTMTNAQPEALRKEIRDDVFWVS